MAMVDDGEPSGDTPSFETQKTDSGKNLMDAVEISFICSFLLWQPIYSGKSAVKKELQHDTHFGTSAMNLF